MTNGVRAAKVSPRAERSPRAREEATIGNDQVDRLTRVVAINVVVAVGSAFVLLYGFPDRTTQLWAWTIKPSMTPMLMGAGYLAGAYFFWRVWRASQWHTVTLGFLPVTAFASSMGVATFLHWDRFNHSHPVFFLWLALYVVTPFLVPALWWRNRRADPGPQPGEAMLPAAARWVFLVLGLAESAFVIAMFVQPQWAIDAWPWKLTPFTARVVAGWFSLTAVIGLVIWADGRWSAARIPLQSALIGLGLMLIAMGRAHGDIDWTRPLATLFTGFLLALCLGFAGLLWAMDHRRAGVLVGR